ncbi:uncharacterized protein TNIN_210871 [Trichonephila inaurata madagascariensis]|uniref:Uncharacterized protein n=1 Tax=Trichonephila inaurata madagascariensis TaxID=2747483 RepID=A0A8X6WWJ4_9ARAC|nr:uncharacterized protein TNIN_210871 [Trichonephila inaurata madagascariensis]
MMPCPKKIVSLEMEKGSRVSKFAFIPVLRGKTKTVVSDRIVKALEKSSFCSSNPLMKKLIVQNVQVCCIVVETSGTQSIKVICASVPYLLNLLAKANPKLKKILEDEKVISYFKFFQETDMESLLTSFCTATVIIQKGIKMCYPTMCIQLTREALMFGEVTLKSVLNMIYEGLIFVFHFVWEDLAPAFRQLCSHNRKAVKYLAKNLPAYALACVKGLILFSFLVRRVTQVLLKTFKRSVSKLSRLLIELPVYSTVYYVFERSQKILKQVGKVIASETMLQYYKNFFLSIAKWCAVYSKDLLPLIREEICRILKTCAPILKQCAHFILQSIATCLSPNGSLIKFIQSCYNSKDILLQFFKYINVYSQKMLQFLLYLKRWVSKIGHMIYPSFRNILMHLFESFKYCLTFLIRYSSTIGYTAHNFLFTAYPAMKNALNHSLIVLNLASKFIHELSKIFLHYIWICFSKLQSIGNEIFPCLVPAVCEINSTAICASKEVIQKSQGTVKKIVPPLYRSVISVTQVTFRATQEVLVSSKKSAFVISPVLLDAALTVRPDLTDGMIVVLKDVNQAMLEVSNVYYTASCHLGVAAKNVTVQLPVVLKAVDEVTVVIFCATGEVFKTSLKAHRRVLKDLKKSVWMMRSSAKAAELEFFDTLDEVASPIKLAVSDPSEMLYILKILFRGSSLFISKTYEFLYPSVLRLLQAIFNCTLNCILYLQNSMESFKNNLKPHVKNHLKQILNYVVTAFHVLCQHIPTCDNFYDKCLNIARQIFSIFSDITKLCDQYVSNRCSDVLHIVIPKLWNIFKCTVSILWHYFCDSMDNTWELLQMVSLKTWCFMCDNFPEIWEASKCCSQFSWEFLCKVSPGIWNCIQSTSPVLWNYNRQMTLNVWNLHLQTCVITWNVLVPLTSTTWNCALDNCPKMWLAVSEKSKIQWKGICYIAEHSWEAVFEASFLSWGIFHNIVAKTWQYGIRPVTVLTCYNTSSAVAKSIKLTQSACSKTGKVIIFLSDGLTAINTSKSEENINAASAILRKCIDFSRAKIFKPNSKRLMLINSIKKLVNAPSQIAGTCKHHLSVDQLLNNVVAVTKVSFIPMSCTYNLSQKLMKKCLAVKTLFRERRVEYTVDSPQLLDRSQMLVNSQNVTDSCRCQITRRSVTSAARDTPSTPYLHMCLTYPRLHPFYKSPFYNIRSDFCSPPSSSVTWF